MPGNRRDYGKKRRDSEQGSKEVERQAGLGRRNNECEPREGDPGTTERNVAGPMRIQHPSA